VSKGSFDSYMELRFSSYQPQNLPGVMCRSTVSVDYRWLSTATSTSSSARHWATLACTKAFALR
jgi:hypothetical protein